MVNLGAVRLIADGPVKAPEWTTVAGGAVVVRLLSRVMRRAVWAYVVARRAQAASQHFVVATLFDHYCAKLHVGPAIDDAQAKVLRAAIDESGHLIAIEAQPRLTAITAADERDLLPMLGRRGMAERQAVRGDRDQVAPILARVQP